MKTNRVITSALIIALIIGVVLVNLVTMLLSDRFSLSVDLTKESLFDISDESLYLIESLDKEVTIHVLAKEDDFVGTSTYMAQANEIIQQYGAKGPTISVDYVNYVADPTFASQYPDLTMKHGDILVTSGEKHKVVSVEELFNYTQSASGQTTIASSKVDEAMAAAIQNVTADEQISVTILTGHGEYSMPSFIKLLQNNNYQVTTQNLVTDDFAPDCKVAILVAPHTDFSPEALAKLDAFLYNDGAYGRTLLYTADAEQDRLPNLEEFLAEWGVSVQDGAVFESDKSRVYNYHPFYAIADYNEEDEIYQTLLRDRQSPMLMPLSKPMATIYEFHNNNSTQVLLSFGASSAVRPSNAPDTFGYADATVKGPIPALILASVTIKDKSTGVIKGQSNLLVSGSAGMLDGYAIDNSSFANAEYLLNVLNHLSDRKDLIHIPSKTITGNSLNITTSTANWIGLALAFLLPLFIIGAGIVVWLMRRHK